MFAEVDRAAGPGAGVQRRISSRVAIAGQTAKMTAAAEHQTSERVFQRAARSGIACADNDCQDQGGACARNNGDDNMCASPPPPLTTITIDLGDEDEDGGDCTSAIDEEQPTNYCSSKAGNYEIDESLQSQDTAMADEQQRSSENGGVIYHNRREDIEDIAEVENGQPTLPRPILREETSAPATGTSTGSSRSLNVPSSCKSSRRISWNECVNYALIPTLAEMPLRIRRDLYYNADEEGTYRSATKDEIRALRRHPVVVHINQTAVVEHGNDLFAPRDYHHHSTLSDGNDENHCTRGVEHHLLPRDLRRERSARIKGVVEAVLYDQYYQHERGIYDEDRLAKVSQKRTRQFRRRARELAKADEAEMIAWLSEDMSASQGANEDDSDNCDDEPRDHPMDQSSKSLRIEEAVLPPPTSTTASASTTFKDKFDNNFNNEVAVDEEVGGQPNHHHHHHHHPRSDCQGMNLDCDDFADVNLDSYTSLDQRLEQQYHREMSERLMARICS